MCQPFSCSIMYAGQVSMCEGLRERRNGACTARAGYTVVGVWSGTVLRMYGHCMVYCMVIAGSAGSNVTESVQAEPELSAASSAYSPI